LVDIIGYNVYYKRQIMRCRPMDAKINVNVMRFAEFSTEAS
jgi:hypothetical protein